jgi:hypothetical protein
VPISQDFLGANLRTLLCNLYLSAALKNRQNNDSFFGSDETTDITFKDEYSMKYFYRKMAPNSWGDADKVKKPFFIFIIDLKTK